MLLELGQVDHLFIADGKKVRITIGDSSRAEAIHGELVSESTNWTICLDTLAIEFLIQQWKRTNG